jgi:reactive intermediate/imine deaminase
MPTARRKHAPNKRYCCSKELHELDGTKSEREGSVGDRTVREWENKPLDTPASTKNKSKINPPRSEQHRTIQNLSAILQAADSSLEAVFKVNVFLSDMSLFADMNKAYKQYWGDMKPSRTCVAVKQLPLGTDVEIECQAVVVGKA